MMSRQMTSQTRKSVWMCWASAGRCATMWPSWEREKKEKEEREGEEKRRLFGEGVRRQDGEKIIAESKMQNAECRCKIRR